MTTTGLAAPRLYFAMFAVSIGSLVVMTDASIAAVAVPTIARAFNATDASVVALVTAYQLVLAMTIMAFSALGDRIGQRRLYRLGLLAFALSSGLCFLANSLPALLAIRTLQALSTAAALSVTFGLVRAIYPPQQLGRGLGLNTLASASGGALAPAIGGLILSVASWRWIFVIGAPLAIASLLAGRALPTIATREEPFDTVGAGLCAATFGLVIFGLESLVQRAPAWLAGGLLLLGGLAGVLFVAHARRQAHPVLPIDLLSRFPFALAVAGAVAGVIGSTILLISLPFRLQTMFGLGPAESGAMVAPYAVASLMVAPVAGILSDRIPPKLLGGFGLAIASVALLLLAFPPAHPRYLDIAWRTWLCGAGFALFLSPNARIILGSVPPPRAAAAGGLITTARMIGQALGATIFAGLLALHGGGGAAPALTGVAFSAVAAVCGLSAPRRSKSSWA